MMLQINKNLEANTHIVKKFVKEKFLLLVRQKIQFYAE